MAKEDGVVKFKAICAKSGHALDERVLEELEAWRKILVEKGLLGKDSERYGGYAYGNVSQRIGLATALKGQREFVITATQTSDIAHLTARQYVIIVNYDAGNNQVVYEGYEKPSSEAMTHGSIYDQSSEIRCVFHVHSPIIWKNRKKLGLPQTAENVAYGTPEMAHEVTRLFRETNVGKLGIFATAGHEDGVFSFGRTIKDASEILLTYFERAKEIK